MSPSSVSLSMKVEFDDTIENWQLWGLLVESWSRGVKKVPEYVADLVAQAKDRGIASASVYGDQNRPVKIYFYDEKKELALMLPTAAMLDEARAKIKPGPYPLPTFYDMAYTGQRAILWPGQGEFFSACRVGEYTINFCG